MYHVKIKETSNHVSPFVKCSYCNRNGHSKHTCNAKSSNYHGKMVWVPKGTYIASKVTNTPRIESYNEKQAPKRKINQRFSHCQYRQRSNHYRHVNHTNKVLVSYESIYLLPNFVRQGNNALYTKWQTYPKDPHY